MESLGIGLPYQQLEPFMVTLQPSAGTADQPVTHAGEEFVICLDGAIDYSVAGKVYRLESGVSLIFQAQQPHFFHNPAPHPARLLLVFQVAGGLSGREIHAKTTGAFE
jgi:quercetin dioxygenase-like cupin family protein